jgi:RimJ/RimL family protein N-acetyltransferase
MKELDMSRYKPFKVYEGIETRKINERRMGWVDFKPQRYGPFLTRAIKEDKEEFEKTADMFKRSFPELYGTLYDFLLYPEQYPAILGDGEVFLKGEWFLFVTEDGRLNKIISGILFRMIPQNMAIELSVGAHDPEYRVKGLGKFNVRLFDNWMKRCGAEYAYTFLYTAHTASQKMMREAGFVPVGIMPGFIAAWCGNDSYNRASVVYAQKFYNGAEKMVPEGMELTPEAKKLWDVISTF